MKHLVKLKDMGKIYNMLLIYRVHYPLFFSGDNKTEGCKGSFRESFAAF